MSKLAPDPKLLFAPTKNQLKTCGLIDFDSAEVVPGFINNTWFLIVSGKTSTISMSVSLSPVIYIHQPEYWEIQVVGCVPHITLPATGTFTKVLSIDSCRGTKGIDVMGASMHKQIQV